MLALAMALAPWLSRTVAVTVKVPALFKVWDASGPLNTVPSPKSMTEETTVPSGSLDPDVEAWTVTGAVPDVVDTVNLAIGGRFVPVEFTETVLLAVSERPLLSQTVSVTVKVPVVR
jgi:hypothetical protein